MSFPGKIEKTSSLDKWRCSKCSFDNLELMPNCEICDEPRQKHPKKLQSGKDEKDNEPGINCPNKSCKHFNSLTRDTCQRCDQSLFPESDNEDMHKKDAPQEPKKQLAHCRSCNYENDPTNEFCVSCEKRFSAKRIPRKSVKPRKAPKIKMGRHALGATAPCQRCGEPLRIIDYATNQTDICMTCQQKYPQEFQKALCLFCDSKIDSRSHDKTCKQRLSFFNHKQNKTFDRCSPLQYQTMFYMHRKCQKLHYRKQKQLVTRIKKLGYNEKDLQNLHHYIIHYAPIIIHMHVNTHFHFFLKDTHYRNQFQTHKSSGSLSHGSRISWEDRMFDKRHHSAQPFERVKYGTMNFTNDPRGVRVCSGYGQSYFQLKPHVRDRCTITDMDSSSASATLGTFRFIFHLLMKLSDAQLNSAFEGSKGKEMKSNVIGTYKEIQIHGPVQFATDIQRVYISKDQLKLGDAKALLEQVKSFCSKHSLDYQLFENQKAAVAYGGMAGVAVAKVQDRVVGDQKELNEQDLRPPPPPVAAFGGASIFGAAGGAFGGGGFGGGGLFGASTYASSVGASHFSFGSPVVFPPKKVEKKKAYGVDYI